MGKGAATVVRWMRQAGGDWSRCPAELALARTRHQTPLTNTSPHPVLTTGIQHGCKPLIISFRHGYDLVLVAALMGNARTETARGYSLPTADDAQAAINSLLADR
jgi:hypothetical protein